MSKPVRRAPATFPIQGLDESVPAFRRTPRNIPPAAPAKPVIEFRIANLEHSIDEAVRSGFFTKAQYPPARRLIKFRLTDIEREIEAGVESRFFRVIQQQQAPAAPAKPVIRFITTTAEEAEYAEIRSRFFEQPRFQAPAAAPAKPVIQFRRSQWQSDDPEPWEALPKFFPFVSTRPTAGAGTHFYVGVTFTSASRPTNAIQGSVIFVSDGGAGSVFQGWTGSSWVSLG